MSQLLTFTCRKRSVRAVSTYVCCQLVYKTAGCSEQGMHAGQKCHKGFFELQISHLQLQMR
jgi:hypothetical protein